MGHREAGRRQGRQQSGVHVVCVSVSVSLGNRGGSQHTVHTINVEPVQVVGYNSLVSTLFLENCCVNTVEAVPLEHLVEVLLT